MTEPNCVPFPSPGAPAVPSAAAAAGQQPAATGEGRYGDFWLDALAGAPPPEEGRGGDGPDPEAELEPV